MNLREQTLSLRGKMRGVSGNRTHDQRIKSRLVLTDLAPNCSEFPLRLPVDSALKSPAFQGSLRGLRA